MGGVEGDEGDGKVLFWGDVAESEEEKEKSFWRCASGCSVDGRLNWVDGDGGCGCFVVLCESCVAVCGSSMEGGGNWGRSVENCGDCGVFMGDCESSESFVTRLIND